MYISPSNAYTERPTKIILRSLLSTSNLFAIMLTYKGFTDSKKGLTVIQSLDYS